MENAAPLAVPTPEPAAAGFFARLATGPSRKYLVVFGWLVGLTIAEVIFTFLGLPKRELAVLLISTALVKAGLVGLYFMHLRHEARLILALVVLPVLIAVVFVFGLFPDIVLRWKT